MLICLILAGCGASSDGPTAASTPAGSPSPQEGPSSKESPGEESGVVTSGSGPHADLDGTAVPVDRADSAAESSDYSAVSLQSLELDGLQDKIAAHAGQVVLIDYWATWCGPCLQEFPHTVERSHQYEEAGLRVMTVSCDDPDAGDKVLTTLRKLGAELENYHTTADIQETFEAFDIRGGIPFYQLYDRQGVLRYRFNGAPAPGDEAEPTDQIDIRIRELLDESGE